MNVFACVCENPLFFENSLCIRCGSEVGWCPACENISALLPTDDGYYQCGRKDCGAPLTKCENYFNHAVCNRCLVWQADEALATTLCDCCRYNDVIPDLGVPGNLEKWAKLEAAKRRLFFTLKQVGLPFGEDLEPPLSFDFKSDVPAHVYGRVMGTKDRVFTGHQDGKITINLREADEVEREKARVQMNEDQRTLIGHFHHEIGHYYWQLLVKGNWLDQFRTLFGNEGNPTYAEAQKRYYAEGPVLHWQNDFISAYASMHPWEDFAESFGTYLDMRATLHTIHAFQGSQEATSFDQMITQHLQVGVLLNELSRSLGLLDFAPKIFTPVVVDKMRYIDALVRSGDPAKPS